MSVKMAVCVLLCLELWFKKLVLLFGEAGLCLESKKQFWGFLFFVQMKV